MRWKCWSTALVLTFVGAARYGARQAANLVVYPLLAGKVLIRWIYWWAVAVMVMLVGVAASHGGQGSDDPPPEDGDEPLGLGSMRMPDDIASMNNLVPMPMLPETVTRTKSLTNEKGQTVRVTVMGGKEVVDSYIDNIRLKLIAMPRPMPNPKLIERPRRRIEWYINPLLETRIYPLSPSVSPVTTTLPPTENQIGNLPLSHSIGNEVLPGEAHNLIQSNNTPLLDETFNLPPAENRIGDFPLSPNIDNEMLTGDVDNWLKIEVDFPGEEDYKPGTVVQFSIVKADIRDVPQQYFLRNKNRLVVNLNTTFGNVHYTVFRKLEGWSQQTLDTFEVSGGKNKNYEVPHKSTEPSVTYFRMLVKNHYNSTSTYSISGSWTKL